MTMTTYDRGNKGIIMAFVFLVRGFSILSLVFLFYIFQLFYMGVYMGSGAALAISFFPTFPSLTTKHTKNNTHPMSVLKDSKKKTTH